MASYCPGKEGSKNRICCKSCFGLAMMLLSLFVYSLAFSAESLKVTATAYCGASSDLLSNGTYTLNLLPENMHDIAKQCFYNTSDGDLSNLLSSSTIVHY